MTAEVPHGTGVASISRSISAVAGVRSASHRSAASISGASALTRSLCSDWPSSRGNRCPTSLRAARSQRRSSSNAQQHLRYGQAGQLAVGDIRGLAGARGRARSRPEGMIRSVSST